MRKRCGRDKRDGRGGRFIWFKFQIRKIKERENDGQGTVVRLVLQC